MSLINDALKRATGKARPTGETGAPLQPVVEEHRHRGGALLPVILVVVLVAVGGYFGWNWWSKRSAKPVAGSSAKPTNSAKAAAKAPEPKARTTNPVAKAGATLAKVQERNDPGETKVEPKVEAPTPAAPVSTTSPPVADAPSAQTPAAPVGIPATVASAAPTPAPQPAQTTVAEVPAPKPEGKPSDGYRLQAIYYRLRNPSVVINGKTLGKGETIDGARIVEIQRTNVILDLNGVQQNLSLR